MTAQTPESFEGSANRETWAFWLHVTNDEGWYRDVIEYGSEYLSLDDSALGQAVVEHVENGISELTELAQNDGSRTVLDSLRLMRDDIGSFWRIDAAEIGESVRELIEETS